jgi:hypothetical protein
MSKHIIRARSPKTQNVLYLTTGKTFATRGKPRIFSSVDKAWSAARRLLVLYPFLRAYGMYAHPLTAKSSESEKERAAAKFEGFAGRPATHQSTFKVPSFTTGFALGKLVGVAYRANRFGDEGGKPYFHEIRKSSQPLLVASSDGSQLAIVGGRLKVTDRGIEDV